MFWSNWQEYIQNFFERLAKVVCNRPKVWLAVSLTICAACIAGFSVLVERSDLDIWVPFNAETVENADLYAKWFPEEPKSISLFVVASNVLEKANLVANLKIVNNIISYVDEDGTKFDDLCTHDSVTDQCVVTSIFAVWGYSVAALEADLNPIATLDAALIASPELAGLLSEITRGGSGDLVGAEATGSFFASNSSIEFDIASKWQSGVVDLVGAAQKNIVGYPSGLNAVVLGDTSFDTELNRALTSNIMRIGLAYFLILGYMIMNLGKGFDAIKNRSFPAAAALTGVGLAVASAIGLTSWFGLPFTMMSPIVAFLVVGLAADDAFIIVDAIDRTSRSLHPKERLAEAARHAGPSITVTSFTDIAAFTAGAFSQLPAIRYFCITIAVSVLFVYLLQFFYLFPVMQLDVLREEKNHLSLMPWKKAKESPVARKERERFLFRFLAHVYVPALRKVWLRVSILVGSLILVGFCAAFASKLEEGLDPQELLQKDSFLNEVFDVMNEHFRYKIGVNIVALPPTGVDFSDPVNIEKFQNLVDSLVANSDSTYIESVKRSWLSGDLYGADFTTFAGTYCAAGIPVGASTPAGDAFLPCLTTWFAQQPIRSLYGNDLFFNTSVLHGHGYVEHKMDATSKLLGFFVRTEAKSTIHSSDEVALLKNSHKYTKRYAEDEGIDYKIFPFNQNFKIFEQYSIAVQEAAQNMLYAAVAVGVLTFLLLNNFLMSALVMVNVAMIDVEILGIMRLLDITISSVSSVVLVISVGLTVDYLLHIAVGYMYSTKSDRMSKLEHSLGTVGVSVANGVITTLLGVSVLGLTDSKIFIVFFKLFGVMIVCSVLHGFAVLPCMISFFGPVGKSPEVNSIVAGTIYVVGKKETGSDRTSSEESTDSSAPEIDEDAGDISLTSPV